MRNFDKEVYLNNVEKDAVALRGEIERVVDEISGKGFKNIFLIGAGGTIAMMYPYQYILKTESTLEVHAEIAAEFLAGGNRRLHQDSVCVFVSVSGTTQEVLDAANYCKEKGAVTIGFLAKADTPLGEAVDYCIATGHEQHSFDTFFLHLHYLTFRFIHNHKEFPQYEKFAGELALLPQGILKAVEQFDGAAEQFAIKHKDTKYHMMIGAGNLWGNTYSYAMCILEEMQWIKTKAIHAAEFFHGTLELVEEDTSIILCHGEDETRPLTDRAENFVKKISKEVFLLDTKDYALEGISPEFRKYVAINVNWTLLNRISAYLERERNHPLSLRRYYRVMEY